MMVSMMSTARKSITFTYFPGVLSVLFLCLPSHSVRHDEYSETLITPNIPERGNTRKRRTPTHKKKVYLPSTVPGMYMLTSLFALAYDDSRVVVTPYKS